MITLRRPFVFAKGFSGEVNKRFWIGFLTWHSSSSSRACNIFLILLLARSADCRGGVNQLEALGLGEVVIRGRGMEFYLLGMRRAKTQIPNIYTCLFAQWRSFFADITFAGYVGKYLELFWASQSNRDISKGDLEKSNQEVIAENVRSAADIYYLQWFFFPNVDARAVQKSQIFDDNFRIPAYPQQPQAIIIYGHHREEFETGCYGSIPKCLITLAPKPGNFNEPDLADKHNPKRKCFQKIIVHFPAQLLRIYCFIFEICI